LQPIRFFGLGSSVPEFGNRSKENLAARRTASVLPSDPPSAQLDRADPEPGMVQRVVVPPLVSWYVVAPPSSS